MRKICNKNRKNKRVRPNFYGKRLHFRFFIFVRIFERLTIWKFRTIMQKKTIRKNFPVTGMGCAACAARVEKTLQNHPGVVSAAVNYASATASVEYLSDQCSPEALKKAVNDAGYDLCTESEEEAEDEGEKIVRLREKMKELPEKQREVLTLCFMQGKSYQEVADGLGVSVNTVKTHIKRGLKFLRDELQDDALLLLLAFPRRRVMP